MKLEKVLQGVVIEKIRGSTDVEVTGICHDSRHFQPGDLFVAIRGNQFDGHLFVEEACSRGASAIIVEDDRVVTMRYTGTVVKIANTRQAIHALAANFFEKPSENLFVVGVTGTNGKTTVTHMVEAIFNDADRPTGVIGTIDNHLLKTKTAATHTTPDGVALQGLMSTWLKDGAKSVSMEVSSHALSLNRVDSVQFDVGVFTNLTRDHLDFHKTMDAYIKAKSRLFRELLKKSSKKSKRAILNRDDTHCDLMMDRSVPTWTFGLNKADILAQNLEMTLEGTTYDLITPAGKSQGRLQIIGQHNVMNGLAAIGVGLHGGLKLPQILKSLEDLKGVPGRLERVSSKSKIHVFVDYAHTDDALRNVLSFLSKIRNEKSPEATITTVFGCGGDRDKGKRPLMLKAALEHSNRVVVTSDNPRTEDPNKIIDDILTNCDKTVRDNQDLLLVEPDRKKAIEMAIKKSKNGDVVLIAGKGHEDYQIIGTKKLHFNDVEVAKEYLGK